MDSDDLQSQKMSADYTFTASTTYHIGCCSIVAPKPACISIFSDGPRREEVLRPVFDGERQQMGGRPPIRDQELPVGLRERPISCRAVGTSTRW